ncbi:MAG: hypothetical protein ACXAC7_12325 [Candidatus Hodarchaeales archaeon]|jgi:hypothetical protein
MDKYLIIQGDKFSSKTIGYFVCSKYEIGLNDEFKQVRLNNPFYLNIHDSVIDIDEIKNHADMLFKYSKPGEDIIVIDPVIIIL